MITKVSPRCYRSIDPPASPLAGFCCVGQPRRSAVPVCICSDRSGGPAVPEDGGDPLPGGFLRRAPGLRWHCLRPPSLAVAAAHCHPAYLLPPALLLVSALLLYLCPPTKNLASPASQGLVLRDWALLSGAHTSWCKGELHSKKEREIGCLSN